MPGLINDAPDLRVPLCCRHPIEADSGNGNTRQNVSSLLCGTSVVATQSIH